jgi:DNA-binding beta-propeller fold protein YncE
LYVDLEDKAAVAVVDTRLMKVVETFPLDGRGGGNAGLAIDNKHHILFVACRNPQVMVMLDATNGKFLSALPIGQGCDGAVFNPKTDECFSSQGDGTLTVIKEHSPTGYTVEQTVSTMPGAKTITLDSKTDRLLLIAAEYGPAAVPTDGHSRIQRGPMAPGSFSIIVVGK